MLNGHKNLSKVNIKEPKTSSCTILKHLCEFKQIFCNWALFPNWSEPMICMLFDTKNYK